jgi:hypothetical protein
MFVPLSATQKDIFRPTMSQLLYKGLGKGTVPAHKFGKEKRNCMRIIHELCLALYEERESEVHVIWKSRPRPSATLWRIRGDLKAVRQ